MAKSSKPEKKPIEQYDHMGKERCNNPPVGLVTPETDRESGKKTYAYDPHLDPSLAWAGKAEHTSFEVPTVSLHVHERIDPRTIIEAVRKRNGAQKQKSLFEYTEENPPLREAIEFYRHRHNWSNRLIAGDSLLVMNSLLEKEGMAGEKDGWQRLAKNLRAEVDEELIEAYRGAVSLPFEAGKNGRIAVKIVDDRGIESLKIVEVQ